MDTNRPERCSQRAERPISPTWNVRRNVANLPVHVWGRAIVFHSHRSRCDWCSENLSLTYWHGCSKFLTFQNMEKCELFGSESCNSQWTSERWITLDAIQWLVMHMHLHFARVHWLTLVVSEWSDIERDAENMLFMGMAESYRQFAKSKSERNDLSISLDAVYVNVVLANGNEIRNIKYCWNPEIRYRRIILKMCLWAIQLNRSLNWPAQRYSLVQYDEKHGNCTYWVPYNLYGSSLITISTMYEY